MEKNRRVAVAAAIALVVLLVGATLAVRGAKPSTMAEDGGAISEVKETVQADASDDALFLSDYDATVYTELGEPMLLTALADGKPLVINFWATWCPYCVEEMPDFLEIYQEYGDRVSFAFVDAADGQRERVEDAVAWLSQNGFDELPTYYDTNSEAVHAFGVYSFPTTVVVSAEGEILAASPGMIDPTLLRNALDGLV